MRLQEAEILSRRSFICFFLSIPKIFVAWRLPRALQFSLSNDFLALHFSWQIQVLIRTLDLIKNLNWFFNLTFIRFVNQCKFIYANLWSKIFISFFSCITMGRKEDEEKKPRRDTKHWWSIGQFFVKIAVLTESNASNDNWP